jgi:hypothetical protein
MNRSGPKVTKSSCDWNIVAEKSWKHVKKLNLIRVGGADLNAIITATEKFCHNIEEIQIDELCSESQLAQDLDIAKVLPDWVIPKGVIFNPKDPSKVTLKNVSRLEMNPCFDCDFSYCWKNIFSQSLTRLDFNVRKELYFDEDDLYYISTFLQAAHLKHIVLAFITRVPTFMSTGPLIYENLTDLIADNCQRF